MPLLDAIFVLLYIVPIAIQAFVQMGNLLNLSTQLLCVYHLLYVFILFYYTTCFGYT
jgi:hypothetical protein